MTIQLESLVSTLSLNSKGFKAGALGAVAGVTALVAGVAVAVKATMDWANDLDSLGDVMDGTNKEFAALGFVARKSGVGVDKFTKANVILEKSLLKSNGTLDTSGHKLKEYGINVKDANGNVKTSVQLTDEIAQKFGKLATQQEKVNFLTEIYGKSGADMIDFFDTLNAEGGLSAVTKKVEALGLAIDPERYEQFNRNLEELKLVGLGLAVAFTEKLMPKLEAFLGWLSKASQSPKFKEIKDKVNGLLSALFGGKGGGSQFDLKNGGVAKSFGSQLKSMIEDVVWSGLKTSLEDKVNETFEVLDPAIRKSLDKVDATFNTWLRGEPVKWMDDLDNTLNEGTKTALGNAAVNFSNWATRVNATVDAWSAGMKAKFRTWATSVVATYKTWASNVNSTVNTALNTLRINIDEKLRTIAKTFFNRAVAWGQQMTSGFAGSQGGLFGKISSMVATINGMLRKIVTSFNLTFTFTEPTGTTGGGGTGGGTGGGGGSTGGGARGKKRATGGAVVAGQTYDVAEFNKPERFTPNTSGRVDPVKEQRITVDMDYKKLARALAPMLLKSS